MHKNIRLLALPLAIAATIGFAACGDDDDDDDVDITSTAVTGGTSTTTTGTGTASGTGTATTPGSSGMTMTVTLDAEGDDGVDGEALLTEESATVTNFAVLFDDTTVSGEAVLHAGTCDDYDEAEVAVVGTVTGGNLVANANVGWSALTGDDHVLVVHNTSGDAISCGEISEG